jgi:hypothetical protein
MSEGVPRTSVVSKQETTKVEGRMEGTKAAGHAMTNPAYALIGTASRDTVNLVGLLAACDEEFWYELTWWRLSVGGRKTESTYHKPI